MQKEGLITHSADAMTAKLAEQIEYFELPANFTTKKREAMLQRIVSMYDLLDDVTRSLEDAENARQRDKLGKITAQYVVQVRCSIDILVALFSDVAFHDRRITRDIQEAYEKALRSVFDAIADYVQQVDLTLMPPEEINPDAASIIDVVAVGRNLKRKGIHSRPR